jgi:hypothetical protein
LEKQAENIYSVSKSTVYLITGIVIATYLKIWLADAYLLQAVFAPHDDNHFITLASHILNGDWLGPYDQYTQYTLMKGVFYPLWISFSNVLGIPLLTGQHLLYSLACALFIISLSPYINNKWWLFVIYIFLLLNPHTMVVDRVFRMGIYPALTILVIASAFGLYTRSIADKGKPLLWAICLGLSLSAFWHTREEGIWIVPSMLVMLFFTLFRIFVDKEARLKKIAFLYSIPLLLLGLSSLSLATMNWNKYGVFTVLEINSSEFKSAYSGLLRIKTEKFIRYYPVLKEAREKAYEVSPAFAELKPFIEGKSGKQWQGRRPDIPAAFFIWVFRDAVQQAGYYNRYKPDTADNIKHTFEFYQRMGNEISDACDTGKLECTTLLSPFMPQWHKEYTDLLFPTYYEVLKLLVSFEAFDYKRDNLYSVGDNRTFQLFETVTNEIIAPDRASIVNLRPEFYKTTNAAKKKVIRNIWRNFYANPLQWLFILFLFLIPIRAIYELITRKYHFATVLGLSALAALLSNTMILSLVRITSYHSIARAMSPGYAVLIIFVICGFITLQHLVAGRLKKRALSN